PRITAPPLTAFTGTRPHAFRRSIVVNPWSTRRIRCATARFCLLTCPGRTGRRSLPRGAFGARAPPPGPSARAGPSTLRSPKGITANLTGVVGVGRNRGSGAAERRPRHRHEGDTCRSGYVALSHVNGALRVQQPDILDRPG